MGQIASIGGRIAGITITQHGARIEGTPLEFTFEEVMQQLASAEKACRFALGDLINACQSAYGEKWARWSDVTGLEQKTLRNIAAICNSIPIENRKADKIPFSLHAEVAFLPSTDQKKWLEVADKEGMSKERLRASVRLGRVATAADMAGRVEKEAEKPTIDLFANPADKDDDIRFAAATAPAANPGIDNIHPHVNRLSIYLSRLEREGELDDLDGEQLYRLHLDLMPVIKRWGSVVRRCREKIGEGSEISDCITADVEGLGLN